MINSFRIIPTWKEIFDAFFAEKDFGKGCTNLIFKVSIIVFLTLSLGVFYLQRCFDNN